MTLLVIVLVLIAQRFLRLGEKLSHTRWFQVYLGWMQSLLQRTNLWNNLVGIIIVLLPIIILLIALQWLLHSWVLGILRFFFDFIILWLCLDAYPPKQTQEGASSQQQELKLLYPKEPKITADDASALARATTCEIFLRANEKLFGVLFWFILLGPVGAMIYFLIVVIRDQAAVQNSSFVELLLPAEQAFGIVNWLPVRLLGLSYALVGHFMSGFNYLRKNLSNGVKQTSEFAVQAGFASLNMQHIDVIHADAEENQEAQSLVDRALCLWVVIVALITLGGWL